VIRGECPKTVNKEQDGGYEKGERRWQSTFDKELTKKQVRKNRGKVLSRGLGTRDGERQRRALVTKIMITEKKQKQVKV